MEKYKIVLTMFAIITILIINIIKPKEDETMAAYTLTEVDDKLWRKVKAIAALRGITIRDLIIKLLEKEVKKGK